MTKNLFLYILSLIFFVVVGIFVIGLGVNQLGMIFFKENLQIFLFADILRAIFIFLFVYAVTKYIYRFDLKEIFKSNIKYKQVGFGVLIGFVMVLLGFFILYFSNSIEWVKPVSFTPFYFSIFVTIITSATTAFWEELIMRGFFLRGLSLRLNNKISLVLSASFFGVFHLLGPNPSLLVVLSTFFAGLLLGLVFIQSQNIYQAVGLHFAWNCFQYLLFSKKIFSLKYVNTFLAGESTF